MVNQVAPRKNMKTSQMTRHVMYPSMISASVAAIHGRQIYPIAAEVQMPSVKDPKATWAELTELRNSIAQMMSTMAENINESVELVRRVGCEHMREFNVLVNKTNEDFLKFMADFEKISARHARKTGVISTPDDLALCLSIFEDYQSFQAYFTGVMHHTLVSFTEYSLEAKDMAKEMERMIDDANGIEDAEIVVDPAADSASETQQ